MGTVEVILGNYCTPRISKHMNYLGGIVFQLKRKIIQLAMSVPKTGNIPII